MNVDPLVLVPGGSTVLRCAPFLLFDGNCAEAMPSTTNASVEISSRRGSAAVAGVSHSRTQWRAPAMYAMPRGAVIRERGLIPDLE
jgi:hypothetical protein